MSTGALRRCRTAHSPPNPPPITTTRFRLMEQNLTETPRNRRAKMAADFQARIMSTIKQQDLIASVADALQYISYYHPADYIRALGRAYELEQSLAARDAIAQILTNSRMCAEGRRPIYQYTGIVMVFVKVGMDLIWDTQIIFDDLINEGM